MILLARSIKKTINYYCTLVYEGEEMAGKRGRIYCF